MFPVVFATRLTMLSHPSVRHASHLAFHPIYLLLGQMLSTRISGRSTWDEVELPHPLSNPFSAEAFVLGIPAKLRLRVSFRGSCYCLERLWPCVKNGL